MLLTLVFHRKKLKKSNTHKKGNIQYKNKAHIRNELYPFDNV